MTSPLFDRKTALTLTQLISSSEIIFLRNQVNEYHQEFFARLGVLQRYANKNKDEKLFIYIRNLIEIYQSDYAYTNDDKLVAKFKLESLIKQFDELMNKGKVKTISTQNLIEPKNMESTINDEINKDQKEYFINSQKESIHRFKEKYPNGVEIDLSDAEFLM